MNEWIYAILIIGSLMWMSYATGVYHAERAAIKRLVNRLIYEMDHRQ